MLQIQKIKASLQNCLASKGVVFREEFLLKKYEF